MRRSSVTSMVVQHQVPAPEDNRKLSFIEFVLIASLITGVPYGMEWCVMAAGVGPTLLALIVLSALYAFPMCLVSTELSCMMPTNHGSVMWAYRCYYNVNPKLADFIGFMNALNQCIIYSVGLSMVPIIFADYFETITGTLSFGLRYLVMLSVIVSSYIVNIMNVKTLGVIVSVLFVAAILSFFIGFFAAVPNISTSQWTVQCTDYDLPFFVAIIAWFGSGYEFMGNLMGEVGFNKKYVITAYITSIIVSVIILAVPIIAAATVDSSCEDWFDGYFAVAYGQILGDGMYWTVVVGALVCSWSLYNIAVALAARVFWAISQPEFFLMNDGRLMVEEDIDDINEFHRSQIYTRVPIDVLPQKWLGTTWHYNGVPTRAVLFQSVMVAINCLWLNVTDVVELCIFFYCNTFFVIIIGFMTLKYTEPNAHRTFEVPYGKIGAWISFGLLFGFMLIIMVFLIVRTAKYFGYSVAIKAVFAFYYGVLQYCRKGKIKQEMESRESTSSLSDIDEEFRTTEDTQKEEARPLLD